MDSTASQHTTRRPAAIVTGGSTGYGRGIAQVLKQAGYDVWITARRRGPLEVTASALGVHPFVADAASPADWDRLIAHVTDATAGRIDVLVNNHGSGGHIGPVDEQPLDAIDATVAVNLTAVMYGCRAVVPIMKARRSGTIINVTSLCDRYAWPGWAIYSAAKAGVMHFGKCLYAEVREHGVRVTTVSNSWGQTDFIEAANIPGHPSGQPGIRDKVTKPEELGELIHTICTLPPHMAMLDVVYLPMVQEIMPL